MFMSDKFQGTIGTSDGQASERGITIRIYNLSFGCIPINLIHQKNKRGSDTMERFLTEYINRMRPHFTGFPASTAHEIASVFLAFNGAYPLRVNPTITIGGVPVADVSGHLVLPGLYQFNITVPDVPDGAQPIVAGFGPVSSCASVMLSVER